jgi:hypothetical protein
LDMNSQVKSFQKEATQTLSDQGSFDDLRWFLAKKNPNCKFLFLSDSYGYRRRNKKAVPRYKKAKTN